MKGIVGVTSGSDEILLIMNRLALSHHIDFSQVKLAAIAAAAVNGPRPVKDAIGGCLCNPICKAPLLWDFLPIYYRERGGYENQENIESLAGLR